MFHAYYEALAGFRRYMAWSVVLLVASGLAEGFGIAALLPLLSSNLTESAGGRREWLGLSGDELTIACVGALVGLGLLAAWLRYLGEVRSQVLAVTVERSLRARMAEAFLHMRWTSFVQITLGGTFSAVIVEASQVSVGAVAMVQFLGNAAIGLIFVLFALVVSPELTAAVIIFGALTLPLYRRAGRRSTALSTQLSEQATEVSESTGDMLLNAKYYRSTGMSARVLSAVNEHFASWAALHLRVQRYVPAARFGFDGAGVIFIGAILVVTLLVLGESLAAALVFLALYYRLAPRIQQVQQSLLQAKAQSAWWATWKRQYEAAVTSSDRSAGTTMLRAAPVIEFDQVSLTYPERTIPALADVSCTIAPGACLGVVGESGGGKTTLLDMVTGLLAATAGSVRLDGHDLEDVDLEEWRSHIGLVMQDSPVFHATVLENIAWSDDVPDETRAQRAADMANLSDVIRSLPEGMQSEVGQKGARLSGGQRQRLALARALYRDPWLLILDEATSALDSASEQIIQEALSSLRGTCSMLVVAHRFKTVQMADHILVLSGGRVVEQGSWDELLQLDGLFRRMLAAQAASVEVS